MLTDTWTSFVGHKILVSVSQTPFYLSQLNQQWGLETGRYQSLHSWKTLCLFGIYNCLTLHPEGNNCSDCLVMVLALQNCNAYINTFFNILAKSASGISVMSTGTPANSVLCVRQYCNDGARPQTLCCFIEHRMCKCLAKDTKNLVI